MGKRQDMENHVSAYNRTDTMGKSQLDLILQVYDGAIKTYTEAKDNYLNNNIEAGFAALEKAQRFVTHLFTTLDAENGGEVAENLGKMYAYIINETDGIKGTKDTTKLSAIVKMLENIRAGWAGLRDSGVEKHRTSQESTPAPVSADGFVASA
jgi:flagellar secretion chaperone FliS